MNGSLPILLGALYLRGAPQGVSTSRSAWPAVVRTLRLTDASLETAAAALRDAGHWSEALALEQPGLIAWAEERWRKGQIVTAACDLYPERWRRVLGAAAPPALWRRGEAPSGPFLGIVGSRSIGMEVRDFCAASAAEAVRLGYSVVSGGAAGCDRAAADGCPAERLVEIVPCGLDLRGAGRGCRLSVCAPDEEFSTGTAMERNALIYAASEFTLIGQARFRVGGTWTGAIEAQRRRLTRLIVRDSEDQATRALASLGAIRLRLPTGLGAALTTAPEQPALFGAIVREARAAHYAA